MRSLALLFFITLSGPAVGQQSGGEDSPYLQRLLREAGATSITEAKPAIRPAGVPLKVFVFAPAQDEVRANFQGWLGEWNKSAAVKYGRVEIAADASQADIILARFVSSLTAEGEPKDSMTLNSEVLVENPVTRKTMTMAKAPPPIRYSAKVYCYVVAREPGGLKVLWRGTDAVRSYHYKKVRDNYWNLKGAKDSKSAGDRLRNKFFEMMKTAARTQG